MPAREAGFGDRLGILIFEYDPGQFAGYLHIPALGLLHTLNCRSKGKTVTAYLELAAGYDVATVDAEQVALILDGHTILYAQPGHSSIGDYDKDGTPDLMVKFDRQRLLEFVGSGDVELTLTGVADGRFIQGTDTVCVVCRSSKAKKPKKPKAPKKPKK